MNKNIIIIIVAALMVLSSLAIGLDSATGQSPGGSSAIPSAGSNTAYIGDVVIYADGTVSNPGVISHSGDVYTLASDINGTVTDLMNNSVLNGNGYTINGTQSIALNVYNVTGITIENLIVVNSTYGISLTAVSNALLTNDTLIGSHSVNEYFVSVEFGTNVTIEDSNFQFNHTATDSYGVYAYSDVLLNVSSNNFSGATYENFIYIYTVSWFSAWNNRVMSTDQSSDGIAIEDGASAVLGHNYFNYTDIGIYVYDQQSVTSLYNHVGNSTYGIYVESTTTFLSSHDNLSHSSKYAAYIEYTSYGLLQHDNLSSSTYGAYLYYNVKITIEDSNISNVTSEGVYSYEGSVLNLYNDQFNEGTSSSVTAVDAEYMSGGVNLAGDSIYVPNDYGLYLYYTPYFTVTNSYINATYNIYVDSSILGATVSNNSLITMNGGYTFYMDGYSYLYNLYFTNNTVSSSTASHADYGIYTYAYYGSSNVVISGNRFLNNQYPIYMEMAYYGSTGVKVLNNVFINSTYAVEIFYYSNVTVTGNTIINVSDEGIELYSYAAGVVNVSYNTVENLPGFGSFSYGIDVEDFYSGNNYISHNTVLNGGSASDGIYLYDLLGTWVFDNHVNNTGYAYDFEYNNVISFFNNTAYNSDYGLYSYENSNFSYYSNTFINDNYSLYSEYDYLGYIYANTFLDTQANAPAALHFLYLYYPYGTLTFYHNNFLNETTNSVVQNYYYNPSNYPVYMNAPLPTGGNYWSNYTGSGYNGIGTTPMPVNGSLMDYYPLTSRWISPTVTFMETGLPSGTSWSVSMGSTMYSSSGGSIVFSPTNGQYMNVSYSVSHVSGFVASAASGTVYLNGMNKIVTVSFTPYTYAVTFTESNLPSGTTWSVTLNGTTRTSNTSTITFSEANGTYDYSVGVAAGYPPVTATGTVTVSSAAQHISVPFKQNYTVAFTESGLLAGTTWSVTLNGNTISSSTSTITFSEENGTYDYSIGSAAGYHPSTATGTVTVNSAALNIPVTYVQDTYTITVTQKGLPSGDTWTFTLDGVQHNSTSGTITLQVISGTHNVSATGPSGFTVSVPSNVTVNNANSSVSVNFTQVVKGSTGTLLTGLGVGLVVGAVVAALGLMFYTGTGVFTSMRKGKGGSP